jgi:hypothetical protein
MALVVKGCQSVSVGGGLSGSGGIIYSIVVLLLDFRTQIIPTKCSVHLGVIPYYLKWLQNIPFLFFFFFSGAGGRGWGVEELKI